MNMLGVCFNIFVYVVVVSPIYNVTALLRGNPQGHYVPHGDGGHIHQPEPPCKVCPRHGICVPKVQCPAHVRPGSFNPLCHVKGRPDLVGICCFTGHGHAAESDRRFRASTPVDTDHIKEIHHKSKKKLEQWMKSADQLLNQSKHTIVNNTAPSFGHHLSLMTYDQRALELGRGGLMNLFAAQEFKSRQAISDNELSLGFTQHTDGPFCPPPPSCPTVPRRYRTVGGECNSQTSPSWGAIHTGFERLLPPDYNDGLWAMRNSITGMPLPSARVVSDRLLLDVSHPSFSHNLMFMQFGQFIAHDTSSGVAFTMGNGKAISCCSGDGTEFLPPELQHWACAPITAGEDDSFYGQFRHRCLNLVRTQVAPASDCSVGYAKQMNGATHFADLSHIYGTSQEKVTSLRAPGGLLKTFNDFGRELPPLTPKNDCLTENEGSACFDSGDSHGNQVVSLTILHTIWTREHNRVARALARLNPDWDEDTIFFEARRILQAEFQHIMYNEWIPLLLGPQMAQSFGLAPSSGYSSSYDPHINPSLTAEFATAAMRFGHSTVDGRIEVPRAQGRDMYEMIFLPEVMFQPSRLRIRPFLDRVLTGLCSQPMQAVDPFITEGLTRYLFHGGNPFGLDLASINIQRGRDYGVRSYNHYRHLCGLEPLQDFGQFPAKAAQRLSSVYQSPDDIDLWIGGLLEEQIEDGVVGITFANILADQFSRLKKGDRYFYENGPDVNPGVFTPSQLAEIKKVTWARILCDNSDGYEFFGVPPKAFLRPDIPGNEPIACDSPQIPIMDLNRFKDV